MKTLMWFCDACRKRGEINLEEETNQWAVLLKCTKAHGDASVECSDENIKLLNSEKFVEEEFARVRQYVLV